MAKLFNIEHEKYKGDKKYSIGLRIPDYLPEGIDVDLEGCIDKSKYIELCKIIESSDLPEDKKALYKLVATRFIEFRFDGFAEYYCNLKNSKDVSIAREEQEIMERLACVIIDINDAIHYGFVKMNSFIDDVLNNSDKYKKDVIEMKDKPMEPRNIAALTKDEVEELKKQEGSL